MEFQTSSIFGLFTAKPSLSTEIFLSGLVEHFTKEAYDREALITSTTGTLSRFYSDTAPACAERLVTHLETLRDAMLRDNPYLRSRLIAGDPKAAKQLYGALMQDVMRMDFKKLLASIGINPRRQVRH